MACLLILINVKPSLLTKKEQTTRMKRYKLATKIFKIPLSVRLLVITIDDRLYFNEHISNICKSAANQLNSFVRLKIFLGSNERKVLVNSFVLSNFSYCPRVWLVSSSTLLRKIENLHKRALRFLLNDYVIPYEKLLQKSSKASINLKHHRALCTEVFKTMIDLNPTYMKDIFERYVSNERPLIQNYKMNLVTPKANQVRYGTKSLRSLAPKIWNSLPASIKSSENLEPFKKLIQVLDGASCKCYICLK